ncbi:MAG: SUMF1/EgtB/PvdO family nonheme iron enzyme, partial [Opitutales bacterium]|nr:SUMF1/EgtB/PvdO family nonheme iron enzyme [Opitutales bacterium]
KNEELRRGALDAEQAVGAPPLGGPVAEQGADTPLKGGTPTETAALASPAEAGAPPSVILRIDPAEAGARVWLGAESDVAVGADGVVRFEDFPLGEHELVVEAPGYHPLVTHVEVGPSGLDERIRLVPVRGAVEVITSAGALVMAVDGSGVETRLGEADANGRLLSENVLRIGEYRLRLSAERRESAEVPVELMIGRTVRVERALEPLPGELRVLSVPTGASVAVEGGGWRATGETPATLRGVPAERELSVAVSLRGYRTERRSLTLDPAEVRTLNVGTLVAEAGVLELRILNEELRSGAGVVVKVDGREQAGSWRNGVLRVEGLEVGRRSVEVSHASYRSNTSAVTIADQRTTAHEVRLEPLPGRLTLTVSGPSAGDWSVEVNGEAVRPASGNVLELPAQREQLVRVSARGWQASEQRVTLGAAERRTLTFRLEEARGPVPGQNAEVELPGEVKMSFTWVGAMNMWVGTYEVTNAEFRAFRSGHDSGEFRGRSLNGPRQPVVRVSYDDAVAFCEWLTARERSAGRLPEGYRYRLASGDEWTRFARCGTTREFPWGDSMPPTRGNYADEAAGQAFSGWTIIRGYRDGHAVSAPVEESGRNEWGLYGVGGNVWEWTSEERGSSRVVRGGSWGSFREDGLRVEHRDARGPSHRNRDLGFRVLLGPVAGGG